MAKKNFVLDTNVLLHDPKALEKFEDNDIYLPIVVIEEIDKFKKNMNELGRNARFVARFLDSLRDKGRLDNGVKLGENLGTLRIVFSRKQVDLWPQIGNPADNAILNVALELTKEKESIGEQVIFVTKDANLRIKADAVGVRAEDYKNDRIEIDDLYPGEVDYYCSGKLIADIYEKGVVQRPEDLELLPNQFVVLINSENPKNTALARYYKTGEFGSDVLKKVEEVESVWGIKPRNKEQIFAFELLLDPSINLVTLVGKAGTGKTLLAIASGLMQVADKDIYKRLLISRPVIPMGRDIGFLPGDIESKMGPWMKPLYDNLDFIISRNEEYSVPSYKELENQNILQVEPLTYIRGRSIPQQFIIIDEAQNLTPLEVKTIITRAGEGTKIVLTGDPYQIDNPYVDSNTNGLSYLVEHFKGEPIFGHITLVKGERSFLAERAAELL